MSKKIQLMRDHAVMAGIVALSEHYPKHILLEDRPTSLTSYLYDSIIISSMRNTQAPFLGLQDFVLSLIDDLENEKILPPESKILSEYCNDYEVLNDFKRVFSNGITAFKTLSILENMWVAPIGKMDDCHLYYVLRHDTIEHAQSWARNSMQKFLRMMIKLENAEYDWWHELGSGIRHISYAYMAEEWNKSGTKLECPYNLPDGTREKAFENLTLATKEHNKMLWGHQEKLFERLANCIGDRAGRRPIKAEKFKRNKEIAS